MPDPSRRTAVLNALSGNEQQALAEMTDYFNAMTRADAIRRRRESTPVGEKSLRGDALIPSAEIDTPVPPPHPGAFQPDPLVIGSPHVAQMVQQLLDRTPELKQRVGSVTSGLTPSMIQDLHNDPNFGPEDYPDLNVLGGTSITAGPKSVSLNPGRTDDQQIATLMHELTHVAGSNDEEDPQKSKDLWLKLLQATQR